MTFIRCLLLLTIFAWTAATGNGLAQEIEPYSFSLNSVDLVRLLPPPPASGSALEAVEIEELMRIQGLRTSDQAQAAIDDQEETIWRFSGSVQNPGFTSEALPKTRDLFKRVRETADRIVDRSKAIWNRQRPFLRTDRIVPVVRRSSSGSYPSGHAVIGTVFSIILAELFPEKRNAILSRGREYGINRLVGGAHFRSDVENGWVAGAAISSVLLIDPDFKRELDDCRTEVAHVARQ